MFALLRQSRHYFVLQAVNGRYYYIDQAGSTTNEMPTAKALKANHSSNLRRLPDSAGLADLASVRADHPTSMTVTEEGWTRFSLNIKPIKHHLASIIIISNFGQHVSSSTPIIAYKPSEVNQALVKLSI